MTNDHFGSPICNASRDPVADLDWGAGLWFADRLGRIQVDHFKLAEVHRLRPEPEDLQRLPFLEAGIAANRNGDQACLRIHRLDYAFHIWRWAVGGSCVCRLCLAGGVGAFPECPKNPSACRLCWLPINYML